MVAVRKEQDIKKSNTLPPRPVEGEIDFKKIISESVSRFSKTLARLATK